MSQFRVGQRVRVVRVTHDQSLLGQEATVIGPLKRVDRPADGSRPYWGYYIDVDGVGPVSRFGYRLCAPSDFLAPLTDPNSEWADEKLKQLLDVCKTEKLPLDVTAFGD